MIPWWSMLLTACGTSAPTEIAEAPKRLPDVILVTTDTTRADRLGPYGYTSASTPTLDALASRGRVYERAYSPLPLTIPAHSSIFTGLYPANLKIRDNGHGKLEEDFVTLAERLHDAGYATAGSVAAYVTTRTWGFAQGFDAYYDDIPDGRGNFWHSSRKGQLVVDDALAWWGAQDAVKPRFLWVHLYDAHFPYEPEPPFSEQLKDRPYDAEIAYVDAQIQRLVEVADPANTVFLVVGDHGEGLGDHGELTHGLFVYDSTQHVPWIVAGPGITAGERVAEPVSLVDVTPTLLDLLGLPAQATADGRVVPGVPRPIHMESWQLRDRFGLSPHIAVVDGVDKLYAVPQRELYDVVADPLEVTNRYGTPEGPARAKELEASLAAFGFTAPEEDATQHDPEVAAQLEALGYVEGGFVGELAGELPDPKDNKRLIGLSQRAERFELEGRMREAIDLYATLITEFPQVNEFRNRRAAALGKMGLHAEALAQAQEAMAIDPANPVLRSSVAGLLARTGAEREASALFQSAAKDLPYNTKLKASAVAAMLSAKDETSNAEALALGLAYLAETPGDPELTALVGIVHWRGGRPSEAVPYLKIAGAVERPMRDVCLHLAEASRSQGDIAGAVAWLEKEVALYPRNDTAALALISELSDKGEWDRVATLAGQQLLFRPDNTVLWHTKAQALFNTGKYQESRWALDQGLAIAPDAAILLLLDANLLVKEGQREAGQKRFLEAQAAQEREAAARKKP